MAVLEPQTRLFTCFIWSIAKVCLAQYCFIDEIIHIIILLKCLAHIKIKPSGTILAKGHVQAEV